MTILLGLASDRERRQEAAIRATPEPVLGAPGVLQGLPGAIGSAGQEAFLDVAQLITLGAGTAFYALDDESELAERYFNRINEEYPRAYAAVAPDPATTGAASQFVGDATRFLLPAAIPVVGTGLVAGVQTTNTALDLASRGVDTETAITAGVASGLTAAIGLKAPVLGKTRLSRAGLGVGVNVGIGAAQRGLTGEILEDEYPEIAAQYDAFNPRDLLLDAVIGGVAGAILPGAEPGIRLPKFRRSEADAILTEANADGFRKSPLGVEPVSVKSEAYIQENKAVGIEALARGEEFTPTPRPVDVDVVPTPRTVELENGARAASREFEIENGVVERPLPVEDAEVRLRAAPRAEPIEVPVSIEETNLRARTLTTLEKVAGDSRVANEVVVRETLADVSDLDARIDALENEGIIERGITEEGVPTIRFRDLDRQPSVPSEISEAVVSEKTVREASDAFLDTQIQQLAELEPELVLQERVESDAGGEVRDVTVEELAEGVNDDVALLERVAECYIAGI